jgi:NAD(P)-dependent dehydrogenase (short-subunit alcohol dehydrogenase family)
VAKPNQRFVTAGESKLPVLVTYPRCVDSIAPHPTQDYVQVQRNRVALVTGANKGIGLQVACDLAKLGCTVLMGVRDIQRGIEASQKLSSEGLKVKPVELNVTDSRSILSVRDAIQLEFGRLDILINNAAIASDSGALPSELSIDALRMTFETNTFGPFAVLQSMLPLLKKSAAARVVNVSSGLGSLSNNSDPDYQYARFKPLAYNSSKAALNAITILFAWELRHTSIKVNSADPGFTATDLNSHQGTQTVEHAAKIITKLATLDILGPTGGFYDDKGAVPW